MVVSLNPDHLADKVAAALLEERGLPHTLTIILRDATNRHIANQLGQEESRLLLKELDARFQWGAKMQDYPCTGCDEPLIYTYARGPACLWAKSPDLRERGCGSVSKYSRIYGKATSKAF